MSKLTLRVVQGADRGKVFSDLTPPISIGREEGNTIQLNDERISRYHCKILLDNQHLVLTDLEST
ncbi:MAG: protein FhaA, partial [Planctomycetota bacterium]